MSNNLYIIKKFKNLEPGDVIYANRYRTKKEKDNILIGHKAGPYLIIKIDYDKLYCLYGTSVKPTKQKEQSFYKCKSKYKKEINNSYVDSYFCLDYMEVIDSNRYLGKKYNLKSGEFNKIYKLIKQNKNIKIIDKTSSSVNKKKKSKKIDKESRSLPYEVKNGDIIKKEHCYLVIDKEESKLKCLLLNEEESKLKNGMISNQLSNLEFSEFIEIEQDESLEFVYHIKNDLLNYIIKKHNEHLTQISIAQRGSILLFDDKIYYVYSREGQRFLTYELREEEVNDFIRVFINNKSFYINFESMTTIDYKDNYLIKLLATDSDMKEIKEIREKYLRKKMHNNDNSKK